MYKQNCLSLGRRIRACGHNTFIVHKKKNFKKDEKGKLETFETQLLELPPHLSCLLPSKRNYLAGEFEKLLSISSI